MKFNYNQIDSIISDIEDKFNHSINLLFQFLLKIDFFTENSSYEILSNIFNSSIIVKGFISDTNVKNILDSQLDLKINITYFEYNGEKLICNKFIDWYLIKKSPLTFTQRDDNIRLNLHKILKDETQNIPAKNILYIGGEFYAFSKIINCDKATGITDFEGIKIDAEYNNDICVFLVDYNTIILSDIISFKENICIVNLLNGFGENFIKQFENFIDLQKLIIISCKPSVMNRDLELLNKFVKHIKLKKIYELKTPSQTLYLNVFY